MSTCVVDGKTGKIIQLNGTDYNYLNYMVVKNAQKISFTELLEIPLEDLLPKIYLDFHINQ